MLCHSSCNKLIAHVILAATNMEYWSGIVVIAWSIQVKFSFFSSPKEKLQWLYTPLGEGWFPVDAVVVAGEAKTDG